MADTTPPQILLASDLTEASDAVARVAVDLAASTGATLTAIHALSDADLEEARASLPAEQAYVDVVFEQVRRDLANQLARVGAVSTPVLRAVEGDAGEAVLAQLADLDYTFVVIGVRNRSRIGKFILGSATQEILLGSPTPVIAVPV